MAILTVGTGEQYSTIAAAVAASKDGDTVNVRAGTYMNDFATISTKITIQGVGGMVNLVATEPPPNGKAILVTNTDVTLNHLSFSGVKVVDGNGAGVRYQGGNLVIENCYFFDNQDGLLAGAAPSGSITIDESEFSHNGTGNGQTHNIYVGEVGTLTIANSYIHDAVVGHEIKSRALKTVIKNNRITDGPTGTASYSIDLPTGGNTVISGNIIEQGPNSQNPAIIHFGAEGTPYVGSSLSISGNTILNDLSSPSATALLNQTSVTALLSNNQVFGLTAASLVNGPAVTAGTSYLTTEPHYSTAHPYLPQVAMKTLAVQLSPAATKMSFIGVLGKQAAGLPAPATLAHLDGKTEPVTFAGGPYTVAVKALAASQTGGLMYLGGDGSGSAATAPGLTPRHSHVATTDHL